MRRILLCVLLGSCCYAGPAFSHALSTSLCVAPLQAASPNFANGVADSKVSRPETITETLWVEGEPESVVLDRFAPASVPISTYAVRDSFITESDCTDGLAVARFVANGGNVRNDQAYVSVTVPTKFPVSATQLWQQYAGLGGWLVSINASIVTDPELQPALKQFGWVKRAVAFRRVVEGELVTGELYLGEMHGQPFIVIVHLPAEYVEGYGPRVSLLLKHLQVCQPSQP